MVMQSQGGIELVAELPQSPKKHGYRVRRRLPAPANCSLAHCWRLKSQAGHLRNSSRWGLIENQGRGERDES